MNHLPDHRVSRLATHFGNGREGITIRTAFSAHPHEQPHRLAEKPAPRVAGDEGVVEEGGWDGDGVADGAGGGEGAGRGVGGDEAGRVEGMAVEAEGDEEGVGLAAALVEGGVDAAADDGGGGGGDAAVERRRYHQQPCGGVEMRR